MDARLNTALLFTLAIAAGAADAATRCQAGNLSLPEEIACAKAAQSTEALRHYVQRTRAMHGLYFWDYVERDRASHAEGSGVLRAGQADQRLANASDAASVRPQR
jgi:hypothetical protein